MDIALSITEDEVGIFRLYELVAFPITRHFQWEFKETDEHKPQLQIHHNFDIGERHLDELQLSLYQQELIFIDESRMPPFKKISNGFIMHM